MQFDFNVQANQSQHIDVVGTFIKYKAGTGLIRVRLNGGGYLDLLPGQGVNNVNFTSVDVQDRTGAKNVGTILAGIYDFRDDRISGTVEIINGERTRTDQGRAYFAYANGAAIAGAYPHNQLFNPVSSTRNLVVERVVVASATAQPIRISSIKAALANLSSFPIQSKKLADGIPASVAEARQDGTLVVIQGTMIYNTICSANTPLVIDLKEPFLVAPGWGLAIIGGTQATDLPTNFEFYEEPI